MGIAINDSMMDENDIDKFISALKRQFEVDKPDDLMIVGWQAPLDTPNVITKYRGTIMTRGQIVTLLKTIVDIVLVRTGIAETLTDPESIQHLSEDDIHEIGEFCSDLSDTVKLFLQQAILDLSDDLQLDGDTKKGMADAMLKTQQQSILGQVLKSMHLHDAELLENPIMANKLMGDVKDTIETNIAEENVKTIERTDRNEKIINDWKEFLNGKK